MQVAQQPQTYSCDILIHKTTSTPGSAIFSLHTLASPSGRNVNYDEKQLTGKKILNCSFYLCRFRKYVSYVFPIINVSNNGVYYETPCIMMVGVGGFKQLYLGTTPESHPHVRMNISILLHNDRKISRPTILVFSPETTCDLHKHINAHENTNTGVKGRATRI
jgi:hypothetical protein